MNNDFLASCKADIVAGFRFHAVEDIFLAAFQINHQGAVWLDIMGAEHEWGTIENRRSIFTLPAIRFDLQKDSPAEATSPVHRCPETGSRCGIRHRSLGQVGKGKPQWQAAEENLCPGLPLKDVDRLP